MDWVRPELLVYNPSWITLNHQNIAVEFDQDFMARGRSSLLMDRWIGAYSIVLTILVKLSCLNKKKKKKTVPLINNQIKIK